MAAAVGGVVLDPAGTVLVQPGGHPVNVSSHPVGPVDGRVEVQADGPAGAVEVMDQHGRGLVGPGGREWALGPQRVVAFPRHGRCVRGAVRRSGGQGLTRAHPVSDGRVFGRIGIHTPNTGWRGIWQRMRALLYDGSNPPLGKRNETPWGQGMAWPVQRAVVVLGSWADLLSFFLLGGLVHCPIAGKLMAGNAYFKEGPLRRTFLLLRGVLQGLGLVSTSRLVFHSVEGVTDQAVDELADREVAVFCHMVKLLPVSTGTRTPTKLRSPLLRRPPPRFPVAAIEMPFVLVPGRLARCDERLGPILRSDWCRGDPASRFPCKLKHLPATDEITTENPGERRPAGK